MNTIPDILRSHPRDDRVHHRYQADGITANLRPSNTTSAGHDSSHVDETNAWGNMPNDNQGGEGLAEYTAQDAVTANDGEKPDKTREARVIQRAARGHILKHINESPTNALTIGRQRLFRSCKATANEVHDKYRKMYLGPVPHLLLCLEWLVTSAQGSSTAVKRQREGTKVLQEILDLNDEHRQMR
jgi:hypothetical protein